MIHNQNQEFLRATASKKLVTESVLTLLARSTKIVYNISMSENNISENSVGVGKVDRLPMNLRMPFQRLVFEKLGIQDNVDKVLKDGKIISDYIDNPENSEVRDLIKLGTNEGYEKAAEIMIREIQKEELSRAA